MLELYYNFSDKYCEVTTFGELEMETDSLYVALSENQLYDCFRPAMEKKWVCLRSGDCTGVFSTKSTTNQHQIYALSMRSTSDESLAYSKKNSAAQKGFVCVAKQIAVRINNRTISNLATKA